MNETAKGIRADLRALKQCLIIWLIKKLIGRKFLKSPIDVLWDMIDEENNSSNPDCTKIEAWEEAVGQISKECFGVEEEERQ